MTIARIGSRTLALTRGRLASFAALAFAAVVAGVYACGGGSTEPTIVYVDHVLLSPGSLTLQVGQEQTVTASCVDVAGATLAGRTVSWSTADAAVATVNASGLVRAIAVGNTQVTATCDPGPNQKTAAVSVTVTLVPIATITIEPATFSVPMGQRQQLTATAKDAAGNPLTGRTLVWTSSNQAVATVSSTGLVEALGGGTVTITATAESRSGTATGTVPNPVAVVEVTTTSSTVSAGRTVQLTATTKDAQGATLTGRSVTWTSSHSQLATVTSSGLVTGLAVGPVTITATSEGVSGAVALTVWPAVASVTIEPSSATMAVGGTQLFLAIVRGAARDTLYGRTVTWTSSNTSAVTVSATGTVTALAAGAAQITATVEGVPSAPATVTASISAVASVDVSPPSFSIQIGSAQQLAATPKDTGGTALTGRTVLWVSNNAQVATVSATGVVTGVGMGTATISATSEGKTGTATATVVQVPVAQCQITPAAPVVPLGGSSQLTATPLSAAGVPLAGRVVTWQTSNPSIATVSSTGLVGGVALGAATITASCEGVPNSVVATVSSVAVFSVSVNTLPTLRTGETAQLTATLRDASNNVLTGRSVTWTSSSTATATITTDGNVTAVAGGTASITATSEGKSGTATLTVSAWPVYSVTVAPSPASVPNGGTLQLTATTKDTLSRTLTGRTVTWSSSNSAVATVSNTGLVTGVAVGSATITATSEGKSGTSATTVTASPVKTVAVSPASVALATGGTQQLTATLRDSLGNVLGNRTVTWTTSNSAVATVNTSGLVTGVAIGAATITATSEGKTGTATVTVSSVAVASVTVAPTTAALGLGQTAQLTATTKDASGNTLTGRAVTWTTSNAAVAMVSPNGLVTGVTAGTATITATSETKSGTATITVTSQYTALKNDTAVWVPNNAAGVTAYYSLTVPSGKDSLLIWLFGPTTPGATGTATLKVWDATTSEANPRCAVAYCIIRAPAAGPYYVGVTAVTAITYWALLGTTYPLLVNYVEVSPSSDTISVGATATLTAIPHAYSGLHITGRTVTWSSSNTAVATVTSGGVVSGVGTGTATISATADAKTGTATVLVVAAPVNTVTVSPSTATIAVGATQQLVATLRDASSNILTGRVVTWASSNTSVASVSSTGLVTGLSSGTVTISATSEGMSGSASVTVTLAAVSSVTVTWDVPQAGTYYVAYNDSQVFTATSYQHYATPRDIAGNVLSGRTVSWTSSNTAVATVSTSGLVSFLREGAVNITATVAGVSTMKTWTVYSTKTWYWDLYNNTTYGILPTPVDTVRGYDITVPSGRDSLVIQLVPTSGATGDADLEVHRWPVGSTIDAALACGSYSGGTTTDRCRVSLPTANRYAIEVIAYTGHSGYTLKATYWLGGVPGTAQATRVPSVGSYAGPDSAPLRVKPHTP